MHCFLILFSGTLFFCFLSKIFFFRKLSFKNSLYQFSIVFFSETFFYIFLRKYFHRIRFENFFSKYLLSNCFLKYLYLNFTVFVSLLWNFFKLQKFMKKCDRCINQTDINLSPISGYCKCFPYQFLPLSLHYRTTWKPLTTPDL
jgi:hypothetical protein